MLSIIRKTQCVENFVIGLLKCYVARTVDKWDFFLNSHSLLKIGIQINCRIGRHICVSVHITCGTRRISHPNIIQAIYLIQLIYHIDTLDIIVIWNSCKISHIPTISIVVQQIIVAIIGIIVGNNIHLSFERLVIIFVGLGFFTTYRS